MPTLPNPSPPEAHWEHYALWARVQEALYALPGYFRSETSIEGMLATDLHTLNAAFSATIEDQVVSSLNEMRGLWDPERKYQSFIFVRQSQTFPDVLLISRDNGRKILLGIELKAWYLLGKEGMPNYRFQVTKDACAQADLLCVVPWHLSSVLAGRPVLATPYIVLARHAAERRNHYWQCVRETASDTAIASPANVSPYPAAADHIGDKAASDSGGNFGRIARYGLMDEYLEDARKVHVAGIPAGDWLKFFRQHQV